MRQSVKINGQAKINRALRFLDPSYRIQINEIKVNSNSKHETLKKKIAESLIKNGKSIVTEARFKKIGNKSGRADIVILDDFICVEILDNESDERFESKKNYYPSQFQLIKLRVTK